MLQEACCDEGGVKCLVWRGWDGEEEYGEGDKVYVTDTNDYYTAS